MTMSTNILFSSPPNYGPPVINTEYAYKCFPVRKFKQGNDDGKSKRMFMRLFGVFWCEVSGTPENFFVWVWQGSFI